MEIIPTPRPMYTPDNIAISDYTICKIFPIISLESHVMYIGNKVEIS